MLVLTQGNNNKGSNIQNNVPLIPFQYLPTLNKILVQLLLFVPTGRKYLQSTRTQKNQVNTYVSK